MKEKIDHFPELVEEFLYLIRSFSRDDLKISSEPLIDCFAGSEDFFVVRKNLDSHLDKLYSTLQTLP
jgi:hypothetical protein